MLHKELNTNGVMERNWVSSKDGVIQERLGYVILKLRSEKKKKRSVSLYDNEQHSRQRGSEGKASGKKNIIEQDDWSITGVL